MLYLRITLYKRIAFRTPDNIAISKQASIPLYILYGRLARATLLTNKLTGLLKGRTMVASRYISSSGTTAAIYIIMTLASNFGCRAELPVSLIATYRRIRLHAATGEIAHGTVYSCDYVVDNGGELKGAPLRLPGVVSTWSSLCSFPSIPLFRLTRGSLFGCNIRSYEYLRTDVLIFIYIDVYIYIFIYIYILMNIEVSC